MWQIVLFGFSFLFYSNAFPLAGKDVHRAESSLKTSSFTDHFMFQDHFSLKKSPASSWGNVTSAKDLVLLWCAMLHRLPLVVRQFQSKFIPFFPACGKLAQTLEELIEKSDRWLCGSHEAATPSIPEEREGSRPPSHISLPRVLSGRTAECASSEQQGCGQYEVTQTMPQRNGTIPEQKVRVTF